MDGWEELLRFEGPKIKINKSLKPWALKRQVLVTGKAIADA